MKWLPEALADVARMHDFLNRKNPQAAARAAAAILDGASILQINPEIGRPMADETGRREWAVAFGASAYVLRYRIGAEGEPVIIRVWHSLENRR
jgi:plasmid stabilization system protein ParE